MQKVVAGRITSFQEFAQYLNQQLEKNPGWKIDKIYQTSCNGRTNAVVIFVGPDGTNGPKALYENDAVV